MTSEVREQMRTLAQEFTPVARLVILCRETQQLSVADPDGAAANMDRLIRLATQGLFKPRIAETYPMAHFAEAMDVASRGTSAGRIALVMD